MSAALRILPLLVLLGCRADPMAQPADAGDPLGAVPQAALAKLSQKRIYFGHQSVGRNIVEGLDALVRERPGLGLKIVESRSPEALAGPAFVHARNGENGAPLTKIRDFADAIEVRGLGEKTDIALFKFCYVDFPPGTDVEKVFSEYKSTLARLRQRFPEVTFVHVTSPLTAVESGPRSLLERVLGRKPAEAEANVVRHRFNTLMRKEYAGREPLYDLAAVESTLPDGQAVTFEHEGWSYPALAAEYASDGRHLNATGGRRAAANLLETLAAAAE